MGSPMVTPVAMPGPLLVTTTMNAIVSPTLGFALLTVFRTARSACCGVSVALALLFVVTGSNWSLWLIDAVLVTVLGLSTRAVRVSVCAADGVTVPTLQTPVVGVYVPWLGLVDRSVRPAGSRSCRVTLVAALGPLFDTATRNVIVSPTLGVASLTVLATTRSACCGVSVTLA